MVPVCRRSNLSKKVDPIYGYKDDPQAETYDLIAEFDYAIIVE